MIETTQVFLLANDAECIVRDAERHLKNGDLAEAHKQLYRAIHKLEEAGIRRLGTVQTEGRAMIDRAIENDRNRDYLLRMTDSIRGFTHCLRLGDFDVVPKLYFEFTDMSKMYGAEVTIREAFSRS